MVWKAIEQATARTQGSVGCDQDFPLYWDGKPMRVLSRVTVLIYVFKGYELGILPSLYRWEH